MGAAFSGASSCGGRSSNQEEGSNTRVAVLGGAFDPPTLNHLLGAAEIIHSGMADEVWIMPCGPRPDKPMLSSPIHRFMMTQLAVNTYFSPDFPVFVSDEEVHSPESLATYDSLSFLRTKHPKCEFSYVIGSDWLQEGADLRTWTSKDPNTGKQIVTGDKLLKEFDFLVLQRPGYDVKDISKFGERMKWLEMPDGMQFMEGNLSSTEIRKRSDMSYRLNKSLSLIEGLCVPSVYGYINRHRLYIPNDAPMLARDVSPQRASIDEAPANTQAKKKNVAEFGGAYDPPTHAHMFMIAEIVHSGLADEALLVPCGPRPDKPKLRAPLTRYSMCELAVNTAFSHAMPVKASSLEVFEKEALATYDTLCALRDQDPETNFMFVIGSDWLTPNNDLRKWTSKDPKTGGQIVTGDKLVNEFDFIVLKRPGYEVPDLQAFGPRMRWMEMPQGMKAIQANTSSTEVRKRASSLRMVDGLVPSGVYNHMKRAKVYD